MKTYFIKIVFLFSFFLLAFLPLSVFAGSEHNMSGWAWSSKVGWVSFNSTNTGGVIDYGVNKNADGTLAGYAWSSNIGWIKFGGLTGFPTGGGTQAQNANIEGINLKGWAKALAADGNGWDGWISFAGSGYGIKFDSRTGLFSQCNNMTSSCAWGSDVVGWFGFNGVIVEDLSMMVGTCSDGIMNGNETGIDTGGRCGTGGTCSDGIMNGNETGIDTGGRCGTGGTCSDGIMNGNETGIDTGGRCTGTCSDGIMNGNETGIDTGGRCDGGWSVWSDWGDCISGTQTRNRTCTAPARSGRGIDCSGPSVQTQACSVVTVNGACATTHYNCSTGTSGNNISNPSRWTWTCNGSGTSHTNASCSENKIPTFIEP